MNELRAFCWCKNRLRYGVDSSEGTELAVIFGL